MIDDPEEEAWLEIERKQTTQHLWKKFRFKNLEEAFGFYMIAPGERVASDDEVRRHFVAGWEAALEQDKSD